MKRQGPFVRIDSSIDGQHLRIGLRGTEPKKPDFTGHRMIEAVLAK